MKTCPQCSFMMEDHEVVCSTCSTQQPETFPVDHLAESAASGGAGASGSAAAGGSMPGGATLLMERPTFAAATAPVQFRDPGRSRRLIRSLVALGALVAVAGVLGAMALRGEGPLASTAVSLGLADPPPVEMPQHWARVASDAGRFSAEVPAGAEEVSEAVDADDPAGAVLVGYRSDLGEEGELGVYSTDLGLGPALAGVDDAGFSQLVDVFLSAADYGLETVRRDVLVGVGRVKDSVVARPDGEGAARIRFMLAGDRLHILVTEGPDAGAEELDEAHARLLAGFEPTL